MSVKNSIKPYEFTQVKESITKMERNLRISLEGTAKRDLGCFYTPDFIAEYMVTNAIFTRIEYLLSKHLNTTSPSFSIHKFIAENDANKATYLLEVILPNFSICDLSMGWGVFLLQAFDVLFDLYQSCFKIINVGSHSSQKDKGLKEYEQVSFIVNSIIQNNIFGVDLSPESVELAGLKLIEKAFHYLQREKVLLPSPNLILGNSLLGFEFTKLNERNKKSINLDFSRLVVSKFKDNEKETLQRWMRGYAEEIHWSRAFPNVRQNGGFDIIVGNPPYINVKRIELTERKIYSKLYDTYNSNGDLSNIFWERSVNLCKDGGIISFISPRYWIEGSDSSGLREFLVDKSTIIEVIDFRSNRTLFNQTEIKLGVDTAIITIGKKPIVEETVQVFILNHNIQITTIDKKKFHNIKFAHSNLANDKWIFEKTSLISEMEEKAKFRLGDDKKNQIFKGICFIGKGCSTGSNKIFRLTKINDSTFKGANNTTINLNQEEKTYIRRLVKSSDIERFNWNQREQFWIYLKNQDISQYPNLQSYLKSFKHLLEKKQKKYGLRNYYDYVAYRSLSLIENRPNIICPYQANKNRFAIITEETPSTIYETDVITLVIKDEYLNKFSWFYLLGVLNSELMQYYTKIMNKKVYN
ncbi:MAG: Eco57I restriction-modification methylase domain-containing protein, partial [Candidatus Heimdallarchaeota archaeon]|nr:Eco57I restriction-modification methylase domain-containing protein [Candidatus Heimdallarchaeota archaeon]